ncbi:MAG: D-glycerate dehydrogenase, partial [Proteobacteria bacterium]|nr:D-glycerate dehydrogenase [Pseudomonadota bacterium]
MKPKVVLTRKLPDVTETRMRELFDAELRAQDTPLDPDKLVAAMQDTDVLVPTVTDKLTKDILSKAGDRLKLIASFGTGWSPTGMLGHRINGKRLGIIGMGQIGQA